MQEELDAQEQLEKFEKIGFTNLLHMAIQVKYERRYLHTLVVADFASRVVRATKWVRQADGTIVRKETNGKDAL